MNYDDWKLGSPSEPQDVCIHCYDREPALGEELCPRCIELEDFYSEDEKEQIRS
jgi:hypothetical protein